MLGPQRAAIFMCQLHLCFLLAACGCVLVLGNCMQVTPPSTVAAAAVARCCALGSLRGGQCTVDSALGPVHTHAAWLACAARQATGVCSAGQLQLANELLGGCRGRPQTFD